MSRLTNPKQWAERPASYYPPAQGRDFALLSDQDRADRSRYEQVNFEMFGGENYESELVNRLRMLSLRV